MNVVHMCSTRSINNMDPFANGVGTFSKRGNHLGTNFFSASSKGSQLQTLFAFGNLFKIGSSFVTNACAHSQLACEKNACAPCVAASSSDWEATSQGCSREIPFLPFSFVPSVQHECQCSGAKHLPCNVAFFLLCLQMTHHVAKRLATSPNVTNVSHCLTMSWKVSNNFGTSNTKRLAFQNGWSSGKPCKIVSPCCRSLTPPTNYHSGVPVLGLRLSPTFMPRCPHSKVPHSSHQTLVVASCSS